MAFQKPIKYEALRVHKIWIKKLTFYIYTQMILLAYNQLNSTNTLLWSGISFSMSAEADFLEDFGLSKNASV